MAIIGVMGSGRCEWIEWAEPLGQWIARAGYDLLTGGGQGVMRSSARAFSETPGRRGRSIGIVPTRRDSQQGFVALEGYPNPYIDISILTPLPRREPDAPDGAVSRNYVNVLSSDVVIALPGGQGTLDEIGLAVRFGKPLMCFGPTAAFESLPHDVGYSDELDEVSRFILNCLPGQARQDRGKVQPTLRQRCPLFPWCQPSRLGQAAL